MSEPHSIIARNKDRKVIGVKLGFIFSRKNPPKEVDIRWMASLPFGKPKVMTSAERDCSVYKWKMNSKG